MAFGWLCTKAKTQVVLSILKKYLNDPHTAEALVKNRICFWLHSC